MKSKSTELEMIFTYDDVPQDMAKISLDGAPLEDEAAFIRWAIGEAFDDLDETRRLAKISGCLFIAPAPREELMAKPAIAGFLKRNGKYYFHPNQREEVEAAIIEGTVIASETEDFKPEPHNAGRGWARIIRWLRAVVRESGR